ncbi:MAG: hypothetical protein E7058_04850 [Lentisphaerae bacterium]|nr:hypothetical protein [Lentisphaerota bacterium]
MKKHFLLSAFAACGLSLSAFAAPASVVKANFASAAKEVDLGGEYFAYGDLTYTHDIINKKLPAVINKVAKSNSDAAIISAAVDSILRLINVKAFKAVAYSSIESAPGIYTAKGFLLADMRENSILLDNTAQNTAIDWGSLPADTRLAYKGHVNLARVWQMIYREAKFNRNPQIRQLTGKMENEIASQGVDIHSIMAAVNGDVEILVTGTTFQDAAIKIVVPDQNGLVAEQLQKFLPPVRNNQTMLPIGNTGFFVTVVFADGKVIATTNPKLLKRPVYSLADNAAFRAYTTQLPQQASEYLVFDIPQEMLDLGRALAMQQGGEKAAAIFDHLQPVSAVAAAETKHNGIKSTIISNFSFYQLPLQLLTKVAEISADFVPANNNY